MRERPDFLLQAIFTLFVMIHVTARPCSAFIGINKALSWKSPQLYPPLIDGRNRELHTIAATGGARRADRVRIHLIPISDFSSELSFLSLPDSYRACIDKNGRFRNDCDNPEPYVLCIAEEDDLPDVARLIVDAFGATAITLGGDLSGFEKAFAEPPVGLWNAYTDIVAYADVLSGLRGRMKDRLSNSNIDPPSRLGSSREEIVDTAAKSSLFVVLARPRPGEKIGIDAIASVELRLQPTDAKIPFSQPWLDGIERKFADLVGFDMPTKDKDLQPYLSNLCVSKSARGLNIGKALVRCIENIATSKWGYTKLYLHVDTENTPALNLYKKEGFQDVGIRWNPFWAGGASEIGYFVKKY